MVTLVVCFYFFIIIFALMGSLRGWGKEVLVTFSVILALAMITLVEDMLPYTKDLFVEGSIDQFWVNTIILAALVFFGYQTPRLSRFERWNEKRAKVQDFILGMLFGALNGYLIFGSFWYFMNEAGYPFSPYITSPANDPATAETAQQLLSYFAPALLTGYWIYVALVVAFIFVMVVFI